MIDSYRCIKCKVSFDVSWDDDEDIYYLGVEDTDDDINDHTKSFEPSHCPFCGTHIYDDIEEEYEE